jgi:tRNA(Ile)-lysidine synthase
LVAQEYEKCLIEEKADYVSLSASKFAGINDGLRQRVLQHALRKLSKSSLEIGFDHFERITEFLNNPNAKNQLPLTSDYELALEGDFLFLYHGKDVLPLLNWPYMDKTAIITVDYPGTLKINDDWNLKTELIQNSNITFPSFSGQLVFQAFVDAEIVQKPLMMKCQKSGDRYFPLGLKGASQKLSDFWVNKKVPRRLRSTWPLLMNTDEVIWIPGFQPSCNVQVSEKTKQVLKMEMIRNPRSLS